ncbi:MAG TPA: hypothetical protein VEZ11_08925, partial [Thermoanaerobaculia bacterium]|nr:hypothetical protein [Thermoanaerobaculia bacterium]
MSARGSRWATVVLAFAAALPLLAQSQPASSAPPLEPGHDINTVDPAPLAGAIAIPLPPSQQKRLKKYEIPELAGARQALGPQLVDGRLPRPLLDYSIRQGPLEQRLSFFEQGLVVLA